MYKFYLDDTEITDQPENWKEFSLEFVYSEELNFYVTQAPESLEFFGDGYAYILQQYQTLGHCGTITCRVERLFNGVYKTLFNALIIIGECTFQLDKNIVSTVLIDESFQGRIDNNKNIKTFLESGQSKNSTSTVPINITSPTPISLTIGGGSGEVYDVKDALEYLIAFVSDGQLNFESNWYDNLPNTQKIAITTGLDIRTAPLGGISLETSFNDLYQDLKSIYNLYLYYDESTSTVFMEDAVHQEGLSTLFQIDDIKEIELSFDTSKLYTGIKLGSSKSKTLGLTYLNPRFVTTVEEEYWFQSSCNKDQILDITVKTYVIDNNIISDVLGGDSSFDKDLFMIQYNSITNQAFLSDPAGLGLGSTFNEEFMNHKVSTRYGFYDSLAYLITGASADFFVAEDQSFDDNSVYTSSFTIEPVRVRDDHTGVLGLNYDTNNNYGNGTVQGNDVSQANSRYTAPSNDVYTFTADVGFGFIGIIPQTGAIFPVFKLTFKRYDSGGTLIDSKEYTRDTFNGVGNAILQGYWQTYLDATDYVQLEFDVDFTGNNIAGIQVVTGGSFFACEYITSSGGTFLASTTIELKNSVVRFEVPLTDEQVEAIKNNPQNPIQIGQNSYIKDKRVYHKRTSINTTTNIAEFEMRSNANLL